MIRSGDFFQKCRNHHESVFEHEIVFLLPHKASLRQTLYKMIPKIVQLMENKSKERKWLKKAVKEELQIFSMLKRPSEMEDVPQKISLRDKFTLCSQILAQTLNIVII